MITKAIPTTRKLNPFAFPPETNAFFTLLAVTAPLWMLELGQVIGRSVGLVENPDPFATSESIQEQGLIVWDMQRLVFPFILLLFMFFLALVIYLSHPFRIRFKKNLRQIARKDDPNFVDAVQELVDLSRISPSPGIEVATGSRSVDGQAFGLWKNYSLRVGGRLRLLFRQDPESFRAIILHELAHIANADISRAYFTQAIWIAVVSLTVIPIIVLMAIYFIRIWSNPSSQDLAIVLLSLLKISGALIIITAIYNNLLRSREFYADWRATLWGAGESLVNILRRNITVANKGRRWLRFWGLHPTPQERLAVLQHPSNLFHVKPALPFLVGALPGLMLGGLFSEPDLLIALLAGAGNILIQVFGNDFFNNVWNIVVIAFMAFALFTIPGFIITYLITNSLGFAVQRETVANMADAREGWSAYLSLWKSAALVVVGFQTGNLLTISSILDFIPTLLQTLDGLLYLLLIVFITIILAFLTWLGLVYVRFFARRVLGSHVGLSSPRVKTHLLAMALTGLLLMFYIPMIFGQEVVNGAASAGDASMLLPWLLGVILAEVIAMILYSFVFAATWLFVEITRLAYKPRCPTCGQITHHQYSVGQSCERCGNELALWLYVT